MSRTTPLARYLFTRLHQINIRHVFGVPGDFFLKALDHVPPSRLQWVGCCNELNAGYAADGYARLRGASALFTTYGVGELSAINAVGGSYAEHVPVIHIVGTPHRQLQKSGRQMHHTLGDGRFGLWRECAERVTVAQANLTDERKAPEIIDETIEKSLIESRPVYIELPSDMVRTEVRTERLENYQLRDRIACDETVEKEAVDSLLGKLYVAKQPLLLIDRGEGVENHIKEEIIDFVQKSAIPTLAMPSGSGMIPHDVSNFYGVHSGPVGRIDTLPFVETSDLVIAFGPMFSDTQTIGWKVVPAPSKTIIIRKSSITDGTTGQTLAIESQSFMRRLLASLDKSRLQSLTDPASLGDFRTNILAENPGFSLDDNLDQDTLYLRLSSYLRPHDIVLLGNGTPILGGRDFVLPSHSTTITSGMWFSIGHMLPAALGAAIAQQQSGEPGAKDKRTVLVDGDGNVQVTVQEISTILREQLNVTIFVINNAGYAYERQIHGLNEMYNDLAPWRYVDAPRFFGAECVESEEYCVESFSIETWGDLEYFLENEKFDRRRGFRMVEILLGKYDVQEKYQSMFQEVAAKL